MSCPFLREGRARYCNAAPVRKLILDGPGATAGGRCTSPAYRECALVADHNEIAGQCPHLEQIHVQYCGASPVAHLVPFSDSTLSRCAGAGYRYCETYLALARPRKSPEPPPDLLFSPNHLWLAVRRRRPVPHRAGWVRRQRGGPHRRGDLRQLRRHAAPHRRAPRQRRRMAAGVSQPAADPGREYAPADSSAAASPKIPTVPAG